MKRLFSFAILLVLSCGKDDQSPICERCRLTITNADSIAYGVSFSGWGAGAPAAFILNPGESVSLDSMPGGNLIKVRANNFDPNIDDIERAVSCPNDCAGQTVILSR